MRRRKSCCRCNTLKNLSSRTEKNRDARAARLLVSSCAKQSHLIGWFFLCRGQGQFPLLVYKFIMCILNRGVFSLANHTQLLPRKSFSNFKRSRIAQLSRFWSRSLQERPNYWSGGGRFVSALQSVFSRVLPSHRSLSDLVIRKTVRLRVGTRIFSRVLPSHLCPI